MKWFYLSLYYLIFIRLPSPTTPGVGPFFEWLRYRCCRNIFKYCGKKVNIGTGARFGRGSQIEIGDYSGIGMYCKVPSNIKIGNYVMMGPHVTIHNSKHNFERTDIPMIKQGATTLGQSTIEDDVWIGSHAIILPGVDIKEGTIVGAGSVVTKTFPPYSIIAGNPARLIRSRK
ncbi:MAG: acyltransferase [Bacteroidota bacterium]